MKQSRNWRFYLVAIFLVGFCVITGCGGCRENSEQFPSVAVNSPTIASTDPATGVSGVAINKKITATFNQMMNASSISTATFLVTGPNGASVSGVASYSGLIAHFTPSNFLAVNSTYTVTLLAGINDAEGIPLGTNYVWSFSSGSSLDTEAPRVTLSDPENSDTDVPINKKIAVTFTETMDPVTMTATTFTMTGPGGAPVSGTITYVGLIAQFVPANDLAKNTVYTGTITTGAKDLAGNPLAGNFTWNFSTGSSSDTTAPTVASTDPADVETGVALNKKIAVVFSESMDPTTIKTTTFTVTGPGGTTVPGTVSYLGRTALFTPTTNYSVNYKYSLVITTGAKDLAGNSLAANYAWSFTTSTLAKIGAPTVTSTDPLNAETGVPINKKIAAVFSEGMDPLTITSTVFTLKTAAGTIVPGTVTYVGFTAGFQASSNLAVNTLYTATITTGAKDLTGNPLAGNYTWTFTTGASADTTAPSVTSTNPAPAETGVALNKKISVLFSEGMAPTTITNTTFTMAGPGTTPVPGTVTLVGQTANFTPTTNLSASTLYTATVSKGVKDLAGNALSVAFTWTFTTGATVDSTKPTVASTDPANGATGVALNKTIAAVFSEGMNPATISNTTFRVTGPGGTLVPGAVTYVGLTASFKATATLTGNATYTATITTGAKDLANNALAADFTWTFITGAAPDITPPTVLTTIPSNGASNVAITTKITANFSEGMTSSTINPTTFTLTGPGGISASGTVTTVGSVATFTPSSSLAYSATYTATITTGAKDLAANPLAANFTWTFTTAAPPPPPTVLAIYPVDGAQNIGVREGVTATFSTTMTSTTIGTLTFTLKKLDGTPVSGTVTYDSITSKATFTPVAPLSEITTYTATIATGAKSLAGVALVAPKVWSFRTGQAPPTLNRAAAFAIMAAASINGSGNSIVGNVGVNPGSVNAIPQSEITGIKYVGGDQPIIDAQSDLLSAFNDAKAKATNVVSVVNSGELGGQVWFPGLYKAALDSLAISTDVTLDAQGNSNAVFIFQTRGSTLIDHGREVKLINGAKAANVYWVVETSATLETGSKFKGNILAATTITVAGSTIEGRMLAGVTDVSGAVTFNSSSISLPTQ